MLHIFVKKTFIYEIVINNLLFLYAELYIFIKNEVIRNIHNYLYCQNRMINI